ncbi:helix-turn-helix domain-containing protein [Kitasatospora sp. NA04385]|uniref:helix-turn-helix domain-containing protein n=1 Tax=Kitasatospora sp. NA04385 TaxID=2742135 RepID=UPI001590EBE1|nr:helix-turn-helix domain-containing protein [Kitasatospora sp. NA04385]QKW19402.1 helix-turn-helix domain-containing protein [Kitasatospora sp. NA04385]
MATKRDKFVQRRRAMGFTQEGLAEALTVDRSTVIRWERGRGDPQPFQMPRLAALLKVTAAELGDLLAPVANGELLLPRQASESPSHPDAGQPATVPDLTGIGSAMTLADGEARVGCRTADGRIIFVTMPHRAPLRSAAGVAGDAMVSGAAHAPAPRSQPLLSPDVHPVENLRQLRRSLVECDNMLGPRQVVATAQEHVRLIQQLRREASGRDRLDLMQVQAEYAEFCSWLFQDSGDHRAAQYWADRAVDWSTAAGDHDLTVYITARKAQLAGDMREALDAVDLAEAAQRIAPSRSRLTALGAIYGAHGYALLGDESACQRAYDEALELVSLPSDFEAKRGHWLDAAYAEAQRARSWAVLGQYDAAVTGFDQAIRALPASFRRDRGVYLARSAGAQLHAVGPEQAAATASDALSIASSTGSARIFAELASLDGKLQPWSTVAEVARFREALDSVMLHEV